MLRRTKPKEEVKPLEVSLEAPAERMSILDEEPEGELVVDVYLTPNAVVIQTPVAGVSEDNLDVAIEGDMVTIRGKREKEETIDEKDYFYQECYWGAFSRTVSLPTSEVDLDEAEAALRNGILTISIPRTEKKKSKKLKIAQG